MSKATATPATSSSAPVKKVPQDIINIWERRFINPGPTGDIPIPLKDPSFEVRWINTQQEGRFHRATREEGWVPVKPSELVDDPELLGLQTADDRVCRGEKNAEILMKIPAAVFDKIRHRKAQLVTESLKRTKGKVAEAIAERHGANAGDWAAGKSGAAGRHISGLMGEVVDKIGTADVDSADDE